MTLDPDSLLNGRYRIQTILGQGGMGAVYSAVDEHIEHEVAVKENLYLSDEYSRQFRREAVILGSLRHPNLPRVSDYFAIPGQGQYLVMDYIEGEDLRQRMDRVGSIPEMDALRIGVAICDALTYLHTRAPVIIHRDLKPGNVKLTKNGGVFLVDFGLVKEMQDQQATTTGARAMTPGYSPPEQYGTARTDPRTDVYSLSATLYTAMTGITPEDGLARATGNAQLTPLRKLNPEISDQTALVIEKALEIDPENRYQTAEDFKRGLLDAAGQDSLESWPEKSGDVIQDSNGIDGFSQSFTPEDYSQPKGARPPVTIQRTVMALMVLGMVVISGFWVANPNLFLKQAHQNSPTVVNTSSGAAYLTSTVSRPQSTSPVSIHFNSTATPAATAPVSSSAEVPPSLTPTPLGGGQGQIAFVSNRTGVSQIWAMDPNGNEPHQVTNQVDGACQPVWSPDGKSIAFISPCPGQREKYPGANIYIWNQDGSITPLPPSPQGDYDPAWSPDGKRIAFTSLRDSRPQIYVYNVLDHSEMNLSNSVFQDRQPSWNPAGSQIAYIRSRTSDQVWIMSDTGQFQQQFSRSGELNDQRPVWSADGQTIFFGQTTRDGNSPWLVGLRYENRGGTASEFRIPADTLAFGGPIRYASPSPDGHWFIFESWPDGTNHDLYRMTVAGGSVQRITSDRDLDYDPDWGQAPIVP